MNVYMDLADATVRVEMIDGGRGTGFHYRSDRLVITNRHVVGDAYDCMVVTEGGHSVPAIVEARSDPADTSQDWAVLTLHEYPLFGRRRVIRASTHPARRGDTVLFAGFPHGIPNLLTHQAIVSGPAAPVGFFLDGSVNGGNSGGPVIEANSGELVGIVTLRRSLSGQAAQGLMQRSADLHAAAMQAASSGGYVRMMGVDMGQLFGYIAEVAAVAKDIATLDANSGIGIAFDPTPALLAADKVALP